MTNFERNIERIREIVSQGKEIAMKNGEIVVCNNAVRCKECDFDGKGTSCVLQMLLWLLEDDGEPSPERTAGQEEAWELAQIIATFERYGGLSTEELDAIFEGNCLINDIMANNTYAEAAEKVRAWEDSKRIKIGDEYFSYESDTKFIVTMICSYTVYVMYADGSTGEVKPDDLVECYTKTGRTLPVGDWLRQIGGQE